ncbi:hypothetical protein [Flavobacterium sp. LC2016-01]|uniref:hypothetical protein n=1 Tax=Flavobacterium sp. LC2016-01 TaxID=2675876 RepID=UPI0012BA59C0|nr:hypothetical protein [Flavobacterium sp. LC2016-01]MTH17575.1 hypothetical protein [Flavobacterium sp. LC2016-01]
MEEKSEENELSLSESAKDHLRTAANWVYVISIIGLIVVMYGVLRLFYDYMNLSKWDDVPSGGGVGYFMAMAILPILLLICVVCFFPLYYLYKFSSNVRIAFRDDDSEALEDSFRYLKLHYITIGISPLCVIVYFLVVSIF